MTTAHRGILLPSLLPLLAVVCGSSIADTPWGVVLVLIEPLVLITGLYLLVLATLRRDPLWAGLLCATLLAWGYTMHRPSADPIALEESPEWMRPLRGCALLSKPSAGPIRLVSWTVRGDQGVGQGVDSIIDLRPDIVIVSGTDNAKVGLKLQEALSGEVKRVPGGEGMVAAVRGTFQYCGGDTDEWHFELTRPPTTSASAMMSFPHVNDLGVVPLMVARMDAVEHPADWLRWSQGVVQASRQSAAAAQALGTRKMVLMTSMNAPASALAVARPFQSAGLQVARVDPNWPQEVGPLPMWPQHNADPIWVGSEWHVQSARVLKVEGQPHGPVALDLVSRTSR